MPQFRAARSRRPFDAEEDEDAIHLSRRQYLYKYPDRTDNMFRKRREHLRDLGRVFPDGRSQPERYNGLKMTVTPADEIDTDIPDEKLWELLDLQQDLSHKRHAQEVQAVIDVKVETTRPIGVVFMSDFHLGNTGTDHRALLEDVELITSCPYLTTYVGGDGIDNMIMGKLAAVQRDHGSASPDLQYLALRSILNRLMPKHLMAIGTGNHDNWTKRLAGVDGLSAAIADAPITNTGERSLINLHVGRQRYRIFRKHRPLHNSMFNPAHSVAQLWRHGGEDFDVGVVEHQHVPHIAPFDGHGVERLAVRTGSYKCHDGFAAEFTTNKGGIGTPVVVFYPGERRMVPFGSISDAVEYLEID